jgi:hypothetical protein
MRAICPTKVRLAVGTLPQITGHAGLSIRCGWRSGNVLCCAWGKFLSDEVVARRWWPVLVPLVLLAVAVSLLVPGGRHQWALALIRQPTPYTAMWFSNAGALPKTAVRGQPITLSFVVSNQEGKAVNYHYIVTEDAKGKSQTLTQASRSVRASATWSVSARVTPSCSSSPCRLTVSLPGHPESIDLLLTITGRTRNV